MIVKQENCRYGEVEKIKVEKFTNLNSVIHWHFDYELVYVKQGKTQLVCNGKIYYPERGQTCLIQPKDSHSFSSDGECVICVITFAKEIGEKVFGNQKVSDCILREDYDFPAVYDKLKAELLKKEPNYHIFSECILMELLVNVRRNESFIDVQEHRPQVNNFDNLLKEMDEKYAYFDFMEASAFMGLNKTYFSSQFHRYAGMTFSKYLNRISIENSVELLHKGDMKITLIAMKCGFDTVRNFNRVFKSVTGYTPRQLPKDYVLPDYNSLTLEERFNPLRKDSVLLETSVAN